MKRAIFLTLFISLTQSQAFDYDTTTWFKGNTHTHSLWSDGNDFPEMIIDWYKSRGYDFLALTDHNILQEGDKWMDLEAIKKRQRALGRDAVSKCVAPLRGRLDSVGDSQRKKRNRHEDARAMPS